MRRRGIAGILLLGILISATACNAGGAADTGQQTVPVTLGELITTITGSGNIKTSQDVTLTFGSGGKVERVYVKEGDRVSKGDVLAKLDASTLELALTQAQTGLAQAQSGLTQSQLARQTAEKDLKDTLEARDSLELALLNARITVKQADLDLDNAEDTYRWPELEAAQQDVDRAKTFLEFALEQLAKAGSAAEYDRWDAAVENAKENLTVYQKRLDDQLKRADKPEVAIKKLQLEAAQQAEAQAQKDLDNLADAIAIKETQLRSARDAENYAQQSLGLARQSVAQAQKQLDEATILAPFGGAIATVGAEEGEWVTAATPIFYLVNPDSLELLVDVDEIDIPDVEPGQPAILTLDALPGKEFSGRVSTILPTPILEGGVVLYKARISLDAPQGSKIRVGMSASADIITHKRSGILLVPGRAIRRDDQGNTVVDVMVNDQAQPKPVVTGISDITQTEIVSGLNEGDMVVVRQR